MGLQFFFGNYVHPVGEVYPRSIEGRPLFTDENVRWATAIRYNVGGDFCADPLTPLTPTQISAKIDALDAAYSEDYKDFGFRLDGVNSAHFIENDGEFNLSGNRVLSRSWDHRGPNEYANTRSFSMTIGCTIQDSYSQIVQFREQIAMRGTGGERWTYRPRWTGEPIRESIHEQTPVELFQEGFIVGLNFLPEPPDPWWPDEEVKPDRFIQRISPRFHGHIDFDRGTHYGLRYRYRFLRATTDEQEPREWPDPVV